MEELGDADPRRVGPYELLGKLGSGGMGRVFLGRSAAGALAAVKVVHPDLARDPEFRRRFQREVAATVAVSGPHVAAIVHADTDADQPWLATEYVAGPSLEARIAAAGPLGPADVAELGVRLAGALAAIHAAGLVHRDVKPSNILLAAEGPKLIDFGIARDTADSRLTRTGVAVGTPLFMAPEQIQGEADAGPAADVFALGGTLVYAATGGYPFGEGTALKLLYRIVNDQPRLDGVAPGLRPVLAACLDKDPGRRPSARQVAESLAAADSDAVPLSFTGLDAALDAALNAADARSRSAQTDPREAVTEPLIRGPRDSQGPRGSQGQGPEGGSAPTEPAGLRPVRAGKRNRKPYFVGAGLAAAVAVLVVVLSDVGGVIGGSKAGSDGAGLAGATTSAGTGAPAGNGSATLGGASASSGGSSAASGAPAAGSASNPSTTAKPGQIPSGSATAPASGPHNSAATTSPSKPSSSHPGSAPSTSAAPNTPVPPACSTLDGTCAASSTVGVVHNVQADKCLVVNTNGTEYQLPSLGSCTSSAAQWRVWWDKDKFGFMLESMYYPGACLPYDVSTLTKCSSTEWVGGGWYEVWGSGKHKEINPIGSAASCFSAGSAGNYESDPCNDPAPGWQLWDI